MLAFSKRDSPRENGRVEYLLEEKRCASSGHVRVRVEYNAVLYVSNQIKSNQQHCGLCLYARNTSRSEERGPVFYSI